jgi:predicted ArsR family transcriptional regulator
VVEAVALDSVPPIRRAAYDYLCDNHPKEPTTTEVADALEFPTSTVRRVLEELAAYRLIRRKPQGKGVADRWVWRDWESELPRALPDSEEIQ